MSYMTDDDTESAVDFEEIAGSLRSRREDILQVFMSHEKDVFDSSELRVLSGIPEGSKNHHYGKLEGWGLIEQLDERVPPAYGSGSDAKQWRLTERGERFTEEHIVYVPPKDVDELARRLVELEREVDDLRETHEDDVEGLKERFDAGLDELMGRIKSSDNGQQRF